VKTVSTAHEPPPIVGRRPSADPDPIKAALAATKRIGVEHFEVTDHPTRLQAAELALKLHGELSPDALVPPVAPRPLVIMIHTSDASVNPRAVVLDALAG